MAASPDYDFELIIVDDHSSDSTPELIRQWASDDNRVRLLRLSRNFGSYAAMDAGLSVCRGDAAVLMASDLQDPPELIPTLAQHWEGGSDIVWAVRAERENERASVKVTSRLYYAIMRRLALPEMPRTGADFVLLDRKVIDAYLAIPEKNVNFVCLLFWMGFRQSFVPYVKQARASGRSKWTLAKKLTLFIDSIVAFSFAPIRLMAAIGALFALGGFGFAAFVFFARLAGYLVTGTGYAALMVALMTGFGLVMLMLGFIGEYLWRTFDEARGRPRFIVEDVYPPITFQNQSPEHQAGGNDGQ